MFIAIHNWCIRYCAVANAPLENTGLMSPTTTAHCWLGDEEFMQIKNHSDLEYSSAAHAAGSDSQIFIVANRLPVEYHPVSGWRSSPGGLVSALEPALQNQNVVWVGWRGSPVSEDCHGPRPTRPPQSTNIAVVEIPMTQREVSGFYDGVCNAAFWPLYHDGIIEPVFRAEEFTVYTQINQRFADCVISNAPDGAVVWVHDYHLQLVPAMIRQARPDLRIGFFLHVPFPSSAEFETLPWKTNVIQGLLGADLIGFQTKESAERFIDQVCRQMPAVRDATGVIFQESSCKRHVTVDVFPIGPDAKRFANLAASSAVQESAARIRADFDAPELILLGVDRLDYTKGIDIRINAVSNLLKSHQFTDRDILYIQVAMPSRSDLLAYQQLRADVEKSLRVTNMELVAHGLRSIHCIFEALPTEQVAALFVAADVMLVTSLADGMNLVSKEFVACRLDGNGCLVLTRTTGAAAQLHDAWLVEPGDTKDLERTIGEALCATESDVRQRMRRLRDVVFATDAKQWSESFLTCLKSLR